jgi:hypothetical protein
LRRLPEGAQEGAPHAITIGKARLPSYDVDRMAALLRHQPGGLESQVLDRLGRRLPGLGAKRAAELAWTEMRHFGDLSNCQRSIEIALRIGECGLDTVGFGLQFQQGRKLRLAAGTR